MPKYAVVGKFRHDNADDWNPDRFVVDGWLVAYEVLAFDIEGIGGPYTQVLSLNLMRATGFDTTTKPPSPERGFEGPYCSSLAPYLPPGYYTTTMRSN